MNPIAEIPAQSGELSQSVNEDLQGGVHWLPVQAAERLQPTEVLRIPSGEHVELPSELVVQECCRCMTLTIRANTLPRHIVNNLHSHFKNGFLRERSKYTRGRGKALCRECGQLLRARSEGGAA